MGRPAGCASGAALGKPQILRLCLRMTFFREGSLSGIGVIFPFKPIDGLNGHRLHRGD